MRKNTEPDNSTFGGRLYYLMKTKNMSQKDLAIKINTSERTINRYLNGYCLPNGENLKKLADIFNTTTDYLIDNDKGKFKPISSYYEAYSLIRKNACNWTRKQRIDLINKLRSFPDSEDDYI